MVLALGFWSLPFHFFMNASANLLVFVAKCLGVFWDPLGAAWAPLEGSRDPLGPAWDALGPQEGSKEAALGLIGTPLDSLRIQSRPDWILLRPPLALWDTLEAPRRQL